MPPFSVLDARQKYWQDKKREWISLGIKSELGREDVQCFHMTDWAGQKEDVDMGGLGDVSIFDPVMCELAYSWFCPEEGTILDPFAGGSVRGVVAGLLGRNYIGIDLNLPQIEANKIQGEDILSSQDGAGEVLWYNDDSLNLDDYIEDGEEVDMIFTCPPYGDLEVYTDDPRDLSNMETDGFDEVFAEIMRRAFRRLKYGGMGVLVVGDYRDRRTGYMRNFVSKTIAACQGADDVHLWNEIIYVQATGTLPMRVARQFDKNRKIGKSHQNMLVFIKGSLDQMNEHLPLLGREKEEVNVSWL